MFFKIILFLISVYKNFLFTWGFGLTKLQFMSYKIIIHGIKYKMTSRPPMKAKFIIRA